MALLDFLKKKKDAEKAKQPTKKVEKASVATKETQAKPVKETNVEKTSKSVKSGAFSYESIQEPHISEKASILGEKNQYTFKVKEGFNKPEIKKSIEGIYRVDVLKVNIIKIPRKKRRLGKTEGFRKGYQKAVVTIKEGQKIEII